MKEQNTMKDTIIYETNNFVACVPSKTHIPREDGGHIWIRSKEKYFESRAALTPSQAIEVMRLTMLIGEAMIVGMKRRKIEIARINYQENGNWAYLEGTKPVFHIHLYGRTKNSKSQTWGQALVFPSPSSDFYEKFESLNEEDIKEIVTQISILEKTDKYKVLNWNY